MAIDVRYPALATGVYRHYKGQHYLVLGIASDSNADELYIPRDPDDGEMGMHPIYDRLVVVYVGLETQGAKDGPRMHVRTFEDFIALLHLDDHSVCPYAEHCSHREARFRFVGQTIPT